MTRRARRRHAAAAVLAVAASAALVPVGTAASADTGACADTSGVTVVVDFRDLGGPSLVRCAPGPVADGLDALRRAGLSYDQPVRFPGMVCRIEGRPADEPCQGAPPADAYWSYWHATGDTWTYSQQGPAGRTPPPGSAEGWSFSTGADAAPPRSAPPVSASVTSPSPTPTAGSPAPPSASPTRSAPPPAPSATTDTSPALTGAPPDSSAAPASADTGPSPTSSDGAATPTTTADPSVPSASATPRPDPATAVGSTTPRPDPATVASTPSTGTLATAGLVVALGVGAAVTARRRQRP